MMIDATYGFATAQGMLALLPDGFNPSDLPYVSDLLANIDLLDHNAYISKESIYVSFFIEHGGDGSEPYSKDNRIIQYDQLRQRSD